MRLQNPPRWLAALAILLVGVLYLTNLGTMGLVGPDEPRYAFIGRAMAQSGDWITPRLWGLPWFEKPALLYWMMAAGFRTGLGPELAPRSPVALMSVAFLAFFWWRLRVEWDARVAWFATAILSTSAGWLAYSHIAVTDLPLAALYSAALVLSLGWMDRGETRLLPWAAAGLGFAAVDKGLVPLILFFPVLALNWRHAADWFRPLPLSAFAICALPWYVLCTLRNGTEFLRVFFVEQQFGRFSSSALQHVQPFWFYVPAGLLLLFPWFPLLGLAGAGWGDRRVRLLAYTAAFGFVFFSVSVNKLPSYVLPLAPAASILIGVGLARRERAGYWLVAPLALAGLLAMLPDVVAASLEHGLRSATLNWSGMALALGIAAVAGLAVAHFAREDQGLIIAAALIGVGFAWFEATAFPAIDQAASARPAWLAYHPKCHSGAPRNLAYGLYYYSDAKLPACSILDPNGTLSVR